ncbi:MAG TPA: 16S rRNA (guanine(527)-N(7))-methyltransferase RsmG [Polyangiales bacterium]|jgi:16S rRNA (guanine527-N7)-methyltransferase|nr:16S rRNA (guanine(527)-N(7))-methyltransferase RsmG [Polyangiales bacterium]
MRSLLERAGLKLTQRQLEQLWQFDQLLRRRNQDRDLTRLIEFESVVVKHYIDSMYVGQLIELPSPLVDVGTGAGFPGVPLKIRYPELTLTLAEQRPRRIQFLQEAIGTLGLKNTTTFKQRVVSRSFTQPMRGVITRAVEPIEKTLLRTSGCTRAGSQIIFMKGPGVDAELVAARKRFDKEYELEVDRAYVLPHSPHARRLVVFRRVNDPDLSVAADEGLDQGSQAVDADEEQELEG